VAFYTHAGTAAQAYANASQIPCGIISDFQGDPTTVELGAPEHLTGDMLIPTTGSVLFYDWLYQGGVGEERLDLTELQKNHTGEVRVVLRNVWNVMTPDPNGNTSIDASPQTGLYGAGYTEGEAILRGYDRAGNLIAMLDHQQPKRSKILPKLVVNESA
jgi:hypothetical protein